MPVRRPEPSIFGPDGWIRWTGSTPQPSGTPVDLAPVDGFRHLQVSSMLAALGEVVSTALPEHMRGLDDRDPVDDR
ncbi:hypothetical protein [Umezawaea sp. Da 62-37]|uniref:hypothetical protein n=1 Tax=Umezawaea sp. Da 62-37 TaxID=3075927 RepID=UPI0028F73DDE|nr:hypothetical protein [Umezawaea sp. Da 62-37]WNV86654.1 hypothetical protein RM788_52505 [Umezawaea sp. Da 62-37]WNV86763.1 hypothetical protein RM788_00300 [Umezawaea sp. Da 62-37]